MALGDRPWFLEPAEQLGSRTSEEIRDFAKIDDRESPAGFERAAKTSTSCCSQFEPTGGVKGTIGLSPDYREPITSLVRGRPILVIQTSSAERFGFKGRLSYQVRLLRSLAGLPSSCSSTHLMLRTFSHARRGAAEVLNRRRAVELALVGGLGVTLHLGVSLNRDEVASLKTSRHRQSALAPLHTN